MPKLFFTLVLFLITLCASAQAPATAGEYMDYLTSREQELSKKYLSYMSEVAHGNRARKMEKRRQELIAAIKQSLSDATRLRPFKGDVSLRDAFKNYWDVLLKVFNEDYHKIVDMEEISEQSYDNMEAYLLAQEKAGEVLDEAHEKVGPVFNAFAENNNIRLIEGDGKMSRKLRQVSEVNRYYHQLYLIFFRNYKQELYLLDAFNRKDINGMEQNRNSLISISQQALAKLDTMKRFNNDGSLVTACRKVVEFHKAEAENQIPGLSDYLMKTDSFNKIRKAFESKAASKRTQADVDSYNASVAEMNKSVENSNKILATCNQGRDKTLDNWNVTVKKFMDYHMPNKKL